jgi:hypothetical protein
MISGAGLSESTIVAWGWKTRQMFKRCVITDACYTAATIQK